MNASIAAYMHSNCRVPLVNPAIENAAEARDPEVNVPNGNGALAANGDDIDVDHPEYLASPPNGAPAGRIVDKTRAGEPVVKFEDHGPQGGADDPIYVNKFDSPGAEVKLEDDADQRCADDPFPEEDHHIPQDDQNIPIVHQQGDQVPPAMAHFGQPEGIPGEE